LTEKTQDMQSADGTVTTTETSRASLSGDEMAGSMDNGTVGWKVKSMGIETGRTMDTMSGLQMAATRDH